MTKDPARHGHRFFPTVHRLERAGRSTPAVGEALSPGAETIRFTSAKGFAFPPSDIGRMTEDEDGVVHVEVAALGLIGPSGVLPHWYHELLLERDKAQDTAMGAFYDIFHHRLVSLFYRAWKRNRLLPQKKADNSDVFSGHLLSFLGLGTNGLREQLPLSEEALLHFSGLAGRPAATAATIAQIVQSLFGLATEVEQFVPRVVELEPSDWTIVGKGNCRLGVDTVCGGQICDITSTFRLSLGPMGYREFRGFWEGDKLARLLSLVRFLAGAEYECEVRLKLKKEEVPPCRLGAATSDAPRLGRSTWLKAPDSVLDADPLVTFNPDEVRRTA
ncbi:type VI secretion system baseplate subunit TssG [Geomonas propionica]|uniref:Type VI secretion system baseplate subunit TssG n=1 Tax=Geomonas propionica TaxID=2798582 RepID=A0ABS0YR33_9BACT|nr:type VI secretion system baseplate subunit TssG [Geomonas propionica]MBJ6799957.1 type VI secretion system baseplate subunit TssG [Geomonas propionica]